MLSVNLGEGWASLELGQRASGAAQSAVLGKAAVRSGRSVMIRAVSSTVSLLRQNLVENT